MQKERAARGASVAPSSEASAAQLEAQLEALLAAEADEAIRREVAELRASLAQVDEEDVEAAEELGELRERATALRGRLAARQATPLCPESDPRPPALAERLKICKLLHS